MASMPRADLETFPKLTEGTIRTRCAQSGGHLSALTAALHLDQCVVAQPGRALIRPDHRAGHSLRQLRLRSSPGTGDPPLPHPVERNQALRRPRNRVNSTPLAAKMSSVFLISLIVHNFRCRLYASLTFGSLHNGQFPYLTEITRLTKKLTEGRARGVVRSAVISIHFYFFYF